MIDMGCVQDTRPVTCMHTVLSNFDALQKIKQAAAATSIKRLEDLTTLQYSSVAAMFDRVAELREADDLVGEPRDSSTYLQFILRKESLERVSRVMLPQMKRLLLDAARDLLSALPKQPKVL